jgi:hypothetical protein
MQMSDGRVKKAGSGFSLCEAAPEEQARQRVKRRTTPRGIEGSIGGAKPSIGQKIGKIAEGASQALHPNWILRSQFPAHG